VILWALGLLKEHSWLLEIGLESLIDYYHSALVETHSDCIAAVAEVVAAVDVVAAAAVAVVVVVNVD
jgi:hypothetical protein